jgi:hypothetical protein
MWATFAIFIKKLFKVNNRPLGENLPNLVTLTQEYLHTLALENLSLTIFSDIGRVQTNDKR